MSCQHSFSSFSREVFPTSSSFSSRWLLLLDVCLLQSFRFSLSFFARFHWNPTLRWSFCRVILLKFLLELISGGQVAGHFVSDDGLAAGWESPLGQAVASVVGRSSEALRGAIRLCCWDRWAKRVGTGGQALTHTGKSLPIPTPIAGTIIMTCPKGR